MKCYNRDQIEAIIVNRDIGSLSSHIDNCPSCSALYEAALKEQLIWHETLFPGKLPDAFDTTVMAALESHTIDPFSEGGGKGQGETDSRCRREMSGKWLIIAAASLVILGGSLLYARPTIADLIRSLLTADGSTDIGIIESNQLGIVQNPGIKVEDKGYTLEINEVVADGARIVMGVKLTDPQGRPIKDKLDWSKLKIINANGTEIAAMSSRGGASNFDNLEFAYTTMDETDRIFVEGNFDRIGSKFDGKPFVYGDWGFRFELDMTEINKLKLVSM